MSKNPFRLRQYRNTGLRFESSLNSLGESSCNLLEPVQTDAGICAAFNVLPFDHVFNSNIDEENMHRYPYASKLVKLNDSRDP